jgi:Ulp1 family protease
VLQVSEKDSVPGKRTQNPYDVDANLTSASDTDGKQPSKQNILLVYPFVGGESIELATAPLDLCPGYGTALDETHLKQGDKDLQCLQAAASSGRNHTLMISRDDQSKLLPKTYVNDTIIDFWLQWITRKEYSYKSSLHCFTAHFYSTLLEHGCEGVTGWTMKKGLDMFC